MVWPLIIYQQVYVRWISKKMYIICFLAESNKNKTFKKIWLIFFYSYFSMIRRDFFFLYSWHIYLLINDTWSHHRTLQYWKVQWYDRPSSHLTVLINAMGTLFEITRCPPPTEILNCKRFLKCFFSPEAVSRRGQIHKSKVLCIY